MASVITYNQVIELLTDICRRHYQLNTFYLGRNWELENDDDILFPLFQVYPDFGRLPVNSYNEYKTQEIRFVCKVVDTTVPSEDNERDVHSDTLRIAQDIVNEFNQHPFYVRSSIKLIGDITFVPLEEFEDDISAGWQFNLTFQILNLNTFCGMPIEEIPGYSATGPTSQGELVDVRYLTCATLPDCPVISDLIAEDIDLDIRVTALEQGCGGTPQSLAQTLIVGNTTGSNNIILETGQQIVSSTSTNNLDLNIGNDSVLFSEGTVKLISDNSFIELRGDCTNALKKLNILTETNQDAEFSIATNNGTKRFYLYVKDSNQTVMQYAVNTDNVFFNGPGSTMVETMRLTFDNNALFNGNVGIGTTTPSSKLQIIAPNTLANNYAFKITSTGGASIFDVANDGDLYKDGQRFISSISANATYMRFGYNVLNNFTPAMSPLGGGDIGIGSNVLTYQVTPQGNVGVGSYVFSHPSFNGGRNIGFGTGVGGNITTGTQNLLFGFNTAANFTTGSHNIQMAHEFIGGNYSNTLAFGHNGTLTGSGQIMFGGVRQYTSVKFGTDTDLYGFATPSFIHSIADMSTGIVDGAGWDWEFQGSRGTGSGVGGNIIFKVAPSTSTGSTKNALINAIVIKQNSEIEINNLSGVGTRMVVANSTGTLSTQTLPSLTGYVPYTGATNDLAMGLYNITAQAITANGTAGAGYIRMQAQSSAPANGVTAGGAITLYSSNIGALAWKRKPNIGSDTFVRTFGGVLTADRVYNLPDATGTIALTSDLTPYLLSSTAATTYQPLDADLTAIAALSGTAGLLRTNGSGTWSVDTTRYISNFYKDVADSTAVTGVTTEQIVKSILIPANTFTAGDLVFVRTIGNKTGTAGTQILKIRTNTVNALTGSPTTIGSFKTAATTVYNSIQRSMIIKNATTQTQTYNGSLASDETAATTARTILAIDWTVNQYVLITLQNSDAADSSIVSLFTIEKR